MKTAHKFDFRSLNRYADPIFSDPDAVKTAYAAELFYSTYFVQVGRCFSLFYNLFSLFQNRAILDSLQIPFKALAEYRLHP